MAKTTYVAVPAGLEDLFYKGLNSNDRFVFSRMVKKDTLLTKKRVKGITARSLFPIMSALWAGLSSAQKAAWTAAANECNLNGWQLFIQDQALRIKNGLAGIATPSLLHQSLVGQIHIEAPAEEIKIVQYHPQQYWISSPVSGKKGMREPVLVTENFSLPLEISLNYSSNLVEVTPGSFAKFYAKVWYSYQGVDLFEHLEIPLDYVSAWKNATVTLSTIQGIVISYELYLWISGLTGDLYFDNIIAEHTAQNWVRDPFCKDVYQIFTRAFYQIPMHWAPITLPDGAEYDSVYKDF